MARAKATAILSFHDTSASEVRDALVVRFITLILCTLERANTR
jgi:hypothetical protein